MKNRAGLGHRKWSCGGGRRDEEFSRSDILRRRIQNWYLGVVTAGWLDLWGGHHAGVPGRRGWTRSLLCSGLVLSTAGSSAPGSDWHRAESNKSLLND